MSLDIIDAERRLPVAERLARLLAAMAADAADGMTAVPYTHLDVYKSQGMKSSRSTPLLGLAFLISANTAA